MEDLTQPMTSARLSQALVFMKTSREELEDFHQFALHCVEAEAVEDQSIDELLALWRATRGREEANAGIRRGLNAVEQGDSQPVAEFLSEFRDSRNA